MRQAEPPSTRSDSPLFRIGKDSQGHWVVQDQRRLCGGLFVDRIAALRFALFKNGNRPQAVIMVPGVFELDMSGIGQAALPAVLATEASPRQRAA